MAVGPFTHGLNRGVMLHVGICAKLIQTRQRLVAEKRGRGLRKTRVKSSIFMGVNGFL